MEILPTECAARASTDQSSRQFPDCLPRHPSFPQYRLSDCKAQSSRTKLQCSKPALKSKAVCQFHGGKSTGPKTEAGKQRIRAAHWKHGEQTLEAKAERSEKSLMFRYLTDLGNHCNLFYKELKPLGRPPAGYGQ